MVSADQPSLFETRHLERCDRCDDDFDAVSVVSVWLPVTRELVNVCETCTPALMVQQDIEHRSMRATGEMG